MCTHTHTPPPRLLLRKKCCQEQDFKSVCFREESHCHRTEVNTITFTAWHVDNLVSVPLLPLPSDDNFQCQPAHRHRLVFQRFRTQCDLLLPLLLIGRIEISCPVELPRWILTFDYLLFSVSYLCFSPPSFSPSLSEGDGTSYFCLQQSPKNAKSVYCLFFI